jgi:hypothetical protein
VTFVAGGPGLPGPSGWQATELDLNNNLISDHDHGSRAHRGRRLVGDRAGLTRGQSKDQNNGLPCQ